MGNRVVRWISEQDVLDAVALTDVIHAVEQMFWAASRGEAGAFRKAGARIGTASVHALGAYSGTEAVAAYKTWANSPRGAQAIIILLDVEAGQVLSIIEAGTLGAMRTAASAAVATQLLAAPGADELALIGTGRQAYLQAAAVLAVRPIRRIRVWSPTTERRERFAERVAPMFAVETISCHELVEAVGDAPIVSTITRAQDPFMEIDVLAPRTHVNAMGSILPSTAELHSEILTRASLVVVDDLETAGEVSRELAEARAADPSVNSRVQSLASQVSAHGTIDRTSHTVFKSVGSGLADLAAALAVWRAVEERDVGVVIEASRPGMPRLGFTVSKEKRG